MNRGESLIRGETMIRGKTMNSRGRAGSIDRGTRGRDAARRVPPRQTKMHTARSRIAGVRKKNTRQGRANRRDETITNTVIAIRPTDTDQPRQLDTTTGVPSVQDTPILQRTQTDGNAQTGTTKTEKKRARRKRGREVNHHRQTQILWKTSSAPPHLPRKHPCEPKAAAPSTARQSTRTSPRHTTPRPT